VVSVFEFGNIRFRSVERDDLKLLHEWENDSELMMFSRSKPMNFASLAQLEKQYEEWIKDEKTHRFIVELMPQREPIGIARIELQEWGNIRAADLGTYIGNKEMWGRGLGRTITVALLEISFNQLNMERCDAWSVEFNERAHKVLELCGFRKGGAIRQAVLVNGRKWDSFHFDILKDEYLSRRDDLLKETLGAKYAQYIEQLQAVQ
jgi:RimJ/RimL family protein N-acetyltransferase